MKKTVLALFSLLILTGCPENNYKKTDIYPQIYNLKDLNTEFDDYNPVLIIPDPKKTISQNILFMYSTNYPTQGKNFDIQKGYLEFNQESKEFGVTNSLNSIKSEKYGAFLPDISNTKSNEYGPNIIYMPDTTTGKAISPSPLENIEKFKELFLKKDEELLGNNIYTFSSDRKNNQQDIYIYNKKDGLKEFFGNDEKADDKYLSYDYEQNVIYFSSNRDGNYHIYKYENKDENLKLDKLLTDKKLSDKITKVNELNSISNDTCPFVVGNLMFFASDREGGKGGYDIYYSKYKNGQWSKPENLQIVIDDYYKKKNISLDDLKNKNIDYMVNTEEDEFRPTVIENPYYNNYSLSYKNADSDGPISIQGFNETSSIIFSSKRKTGKGGFDLHVGIIPLSIENSLVNKDIINPEKNKAPIISSFSYNPTKTINKDESIEINVSANDPEGKGLEYIWNSTKGNLNKNTGTTVIWKASSIDSSFESGISTITLIVSDGVKTSSKIINIMISEDGKAVVQNEEDKSKSF